MGLVNVLVYGGGGTKVTLGQSSKRKHGMSGSHEASTSQWSHRQTAEWSIYRPVLASRPKCTYKVLNEHGRETGGGGGVGCQSVQYSHHLSACTWLTQHITWPIGDVTTTHDVPHRICWRLPTKLLQPWVVVPRWCIEGSRRQIGPWFGQIGALISGPLTYPQRGGGFTRRQATCTSW